MPCVNFFSNVVFVVVGGVVGIVLAADAIATPTKIVIAIAFVIWVIVASALENTATRDRLARFARISHLPYTAVLTRLLHTLPRLILPRSVEQDPPPQTGWLAWLHYWTTPRARDVADLDRLRRNPWSRPVMDAALKVAIVYPIVLALLQAAAGGSSGLGGIPIIPPDTSPWIVAAALGVIAMLICTRILASATSQGVFEKLSTWLSFVATAGAGVVVVAGASAGAVAVAGVVAVAGSVAGAFVFAVAVAFAGAVAGTVAVAGVLGFAFAFALAQTVVVARLTSRGRGGIGYALLVTPLLGLSLFAAVITPVDQPQFALFALTLAVLPLVNAVFDWLSYGITIWLLSRGHRRGNIWPLISALADVAAAAVLFAGLSVALIVILGTVDGWRATPLVGVGPLLQGLRDRPGENWWVVAMVASTLVPTLLHLCLAFVSAVTWFRAGVWNWLLDHFDVQQGVEVALPATLAFATLLIAYVLIPPALICGAGWVIWTHGGGVREVYVDWLIRFAGWAEYI